MEEQDVKPQVNEPADSDGVARRQRSTIDFPYMDLSAAIEVAAAAFERNGGGTVQPDELAAQLSLSTKSSGFRTRVSTAKQFGLINAPRGADTVELTDLGLKIIDPEWERTAKADAFLRVDLFRTIYDSFRAGHLPPAAALERRLVGFGVAEKQSERARQVFERSAETAGYFESGRDKLVRPAKLREAGEGSSHGEGKAEGNGGSHDQRGGEAGGAGDGGSGGEFDNVDPLIRALLAHLPSPKSVWPRADRDAWLKLVEGSLAFIYKDESDASGTAGGQKQPYSA
ncbi:hypothetical protein [Pseudoruegeria sp. HB172150]|uniref:hypothetical protein n=1 Tax=Pseudoruegeria sp. HB172150 TaxID=2721164 RepID=UPI0015572AD4|nr:hypothetical protein [Pseudoruegeria sp. HB172150]